MLVDDRHLKFQGFQPSHFMRTYVDDKLSAIQEQAPYGSTLRAAFTQSGETLKGVLTIYSSAGRFFAIACGPNLKEVTHRLSEQIRKQIARWKTRRFQRRAYDKDVVA